MNEIENVPGQLPLFRAPLWFGRDHKPITSTEANELLGTAGGRRIADTHIGSVWVSTVFLVLDHGHGGPFPVLYETMVFRLGRNSEDFLEVDWSGSWDRRYCFPLEAVHGHAMAVGALRTGRELPAGSRALETPARLYLDA